MGLDDSIGPFTLLAAVAVSASVSAFCTITWLNNNEAQRNQQQKQQKQQNHQQEQQEIFAQQIGYIQTIGSKRIDLSAVPLPPRDEKLTRHTCSRGAEKQALRPRIELQSQHDDLYETSKAPKPFAFNYEVARVFDDMIARSVPLYRECMHTLVYWAGRYYQAGTRVVDLGTSTGSTIDFLAQSLEQVPMHFVGVDNSIAMLERAHHKLAWLVSPETETTANNSSGINRRVESSFRDARDQEPDNYTGHSVELLHEDVMDVSLENTSIVVLNYTLQFVPVAHRRELLQRIFDGLTSGGLLFLSEKVRAESIELHETCTWFYEAFKRARGYSHNEVARKREALMDVLVPFSERELTQVLLDAGFQVCQVVLKWNNFSTFVALKAQAVDKSKNSSQIPELVRTCGLPAAVGSSCRRMDTVVEGTTPPSTNTTTTTATTTAADAAAVNCTINRLPSFAPPQQQPSAFPNLRQIFEEKSSGPIAVLLDQAAVFANRREKNSNNNNNGKKKTAHAINTSTVQAMTPPSTPQGLTAGVHEASAREVLATVLHMERETFDSLVLRNNSIKLEPAAGLFLRCAPSIHSSKHVCVKDNSVLEIGSESDLLSPNQTATQDGDDESGDPRVVLPKLLQAMRPWKKGPLCLFGVQIATEWRSDWKWNRIQDAVGDVSGCAVADLGSANGYFAFRLLQHQRDLSLQDPSSVLCIDPNLKAWMEFEVLSRFADQHRKVLGFHLGDDSVLDALPAGSFDVMLCLGVLYHTHDPIGMLRRMWRSLRPGGTLVLDCQGLPTLVDGGEWEKNDQVDEQGGGGAAVALIPRGRYANAKGIWFLPSVAALENWLKRTNFQEVSCFFSEALSQEEQHGNEQWASVSSLPEALDANNPNKTIEGYPAPYRHYIKCKKPGTRLV